MTGKTFLSLLSSLSLFLIYFLLVVEGVYFSIPEEFDYNVLNWDVGTEIDCNALAFAMKGYGGFPEYIYVRQEMKDVWSIL